jgi:hypothetical protein
VNPLVNAHAIAARIRSLLSAAHMTPVEKAADMLGVRLADLVASLDETNPSPTVDVLAAVTEYLGVDPTWLTTGQYDVGAHRQVMAEDFAQVRLLLHRLLSGRVTPPGMMAYDGPIEDDEGAV